MSEPLVSLAGWVLIGAGLVFMLLGAIVELRREPVVTKAVSKNPIAEIIAAIGGVIKQVAGLFKILKDFTPGKFVMALGLILVILGVIVGTVI